MAEVKVPSSKLPKSARFIQNYVAVRKIAGRLPGFLQQSARAEVGQIDFCHPAVAGLHRSGLSLMAGAARQRQRGYYLDPDAGGRGLLAGGVSVAAQTNVDLCGRA